MVGEKGYLKMFWGARTILVIMIFLPQGLLGQVDPEKPITIYCGYAAGASTDVSARALADGAEKLLGVPVVVDNKPGGSTTVIAAIFINSSPYFLSFILPESLPAITP